jgi:hypothetical protein
MDASKRLRFGAVVMLILNPDQFEAGDWENQFSFGAVRPICDPETIGLLNALSQQILKDKIARSFPDLVTFGYFCRKSNLTRIAKSVDDQNYRFGWGTILHIAPSNIPINFAFSLVMGMLSGNSNIVRMPSKSYHQNIIFLDIIKRLLDTEPYQSFCSQVAFVYTLRNSPFLSVLVSRAQGLVVWGGDKTVQDFRILPKQPRCVEVWFPNRVSSAVIDAKGYLKMSGQAQNILAGHFYNDTYLVDQNACSSPGQILWIGGISDIKKAQSAFWLKLDSVLQAKKYQLDPLALIDKTLDVMRNTQLMGSSVDFDRTHQNIWRLSNPNAKQCTLRFGTFLEIMIPTGIRLDRWLRSNEQTLTVAGMSPYDVFNLLKSKNIDRIVPMGQALNITMLWDGRNILTTLSRKVEVVSHR